MGMYQLETRFARITLVVLRLPQRGMRGHCVNWNYLICLYFTFQCGVSLGLAVRHQEGKKTARPSTAAVVCWNSRLAVFTGSSVYAATAAGVSYTWYQVFICYQGRGSLQVCFTAQRRFFFFAVRYNASISFLRFQSCWNHAYIVKTAGL